MKKAIFFFAALLGVVFFACQKDIVTAIQPSAGKSNFMTVAKAKAWFDETEPKTVWTKTEKQEHYKPQWDLAVQLNGAVEVPVLLEDKMVTPFINPKQRGVMRLLVASLDNHTIDAAIIKYFPTDKFIGNVEDINRDNFREKKFDGVIKLENFNFTDQTTVLIENGQLTNFMCKSPAISSRDYQICYPMCQSVSVPSAGYYGPTVCDESYGQYCVYVPTGYLFGSNGDPITSSQNNNGGVSGGTNSSGAGILGGDPISTTRVFCNESLIELKAFPATTDQPYETQKTGLINFKVEFIRPYTLDVYSVTFDWLIFEVRHNSDPIGDSQYAKIESAVNTAVMEVQRDIQLFNNPPGYQAIYDSQSAGNRFLSYLSIHLTGNLGFLSEAKALTSNPNAGIINPLSWRE